MHLVAARARGVSHQGSSNDNSEAPVRPAEERKSRSFRAPRNGDPKRCSTRSVCSVRPARGSGVGSPGRRIDSRKGVGNSAPRETFRTGCRKARAESRFRWRTKRQPVRGTLSPFEPPPRAAVPVDAPAPVDIQVGVAARDPADETARKTIRLDPAHLLSLIGVISDGGRARDHFSLGNRSRAAVLAASRLCRSHGRLLKRVCQARDARKRQVRVVRYLKSWDIGGSGKETDVS